MGTYSIMESPPGPETIIDGVSYLYFGGTSYLGLAGHPEVIEAGCEALHRFGVHSATTRSRFGTIPPVLEVERRAAAFFGTEEAFYFSSGYVANHILISAVAPRADAILIDESSHYCVMEAARLPGLPIISFHHYDPHDLELKLHRWKRVVVMTDAVGPSTGTIAPLNDYIQVLASCEQGHLIIDDAHGFGVLGEQGRGLFEELGFWSKVNGGSIDSKITLQVCGTLSKALGGFGGVVPGTRDFVAQVRKASHYFDGASAPASGEAGATAKALEIVKCNPSLRMRLRDNTFRLRAALRSMGLKVPEGLTAHFGVSIGNADNMRRIHQSLKSRGILLPYVGSYSGIPSEGILRFAVFANHTPAQLDRLADELRLLL